MFAGKLKLRDIEDPDRETVPRQVNASDLPAILPEHHPQRHMLPIAVMTSGGVHFDGIVHHVADGDAELSRSVEAVEIPELQIECGIRDAALHADLRLGARHIAWIAWLERIADLEPIAKHGIVRLRILLGPLGGVEQ